MVGSFIASIMPGTQAHAAKQDKLFSEFSKNIHGDEKAPMKTPLKSAADLSPQARAAQVDEAYKNWNNSIESGLKNPDSAGDVKSVLGAAMKKVQLQAEEASKAGKPFDRDAALAGSLAEGSLTRAETMPDGKGKSALLGIYDGSVGYIQARSAQPGRN